MAEHECADDNCERTFRTEVEARAHFIIKHEHGGNLPPLGGLFNERWHDGPCGLKF